MGFLGMEMLLGWGPMKTQEKRKTKEKRTDFNIMCDMTKCMHLCNIYECGGTYTFNLKLKKR